jgi:hypothetical protein
MWDIVLAVLAAPVDAGATMASSMLCDAGSREQVINQSINQCAMQPDAQLAWHLDQDMRLMMV